MIKCASCGLDIRYWREGDSVTFMHKPEYIHVESGKWMCWGIDTSGEFHYAYPKEH